MKQDPPLSSTRRAPVGEQESERLMPSDQQPSETAALPRAKTAEPSRQRVSPAPCTNSYDEVPYKSYPYPQTHPDRLATLATLFGMRPAPVSACRVLELACASGGNLIPMAVQAPQASFLGVDLSGRQLTEGRAAIEALGLKNIELRHADILELDGDLGEFDYIIAHGVYSWVPDAVQQKLLAVCRRHLAPQGVAYVSYNTYPGWRMRGMIRDMMCYRARSFDTPSDRLRQSRGLLDFLSRSAPTGENAYGILLKDELNQMREKDDSYLFHDYLEDVNQPLYFYQFVEAAEAQGLQYLGEADYRVMAASNFPRDVEAMLHSVASNRVEMEQYMDFLRNRMFRQTLLCRREVTLDKSPRPQSVLGMYIASNARPETADIDLASADQVTFRGPSSTMTTSEPVVKAAMLQLADAWPRSVAFSTLIASARSRLAAQPVVVDAAHAAYETEQLAEPLLRCYATALVSLSMRPSPFVLEASERPVASPLARWQALSANGVVSLNHQWVRLNDLQRRVLPHLDGTRDRQALAVALVERVGEGTLVIHDRGTPILDPDQALNILSKAIEPCLAELGRLALLEA